MSNDLISREALKREFETLFYNDCGDFMRTERLIDDEPTIEEARPKGKWTNGERKCPCCGEDKFKDLDADIWADWQPNFCPNCGADMRGENT